MLFIQSWQKNKGSPKLQSVKSEAPPDWRQSDWGLVIERLNELIYDYRSKRITLEGLMIVPRSASTQAAISIADLAIKLNPINAQFSHIDAVIEIEEISSGVNIDQGDMHYMCFLNALRNEINQRALCRQFYYEGHIVGNIFRERSGFINPDANSDDVGCFVYYWTQFVLQSIAPFEGKFPPEIFTYDVDRKVPYIAGVIVANRDTWHRIKEYEQFVELILDICVHFGMGQYEKTSLPMPPNGDIDLYVAYSDVATGRLVHCAWACANGA